VTIFHALAQMLQLRRTDVPQEYLHFSKRCDETQGGFEKKIMISRSKIFLRPPSASCSPQTDTIIKCVVAYSFALLFDILSVNNSASPQKLVASKSKFLAVILYPAIVFSCINRWRYCVGNNCKCYLIYLDLREGHTNAGGLNRLWYS
jgi:hypothetical protein